MKKMIIGGTGNQGEEKVVSPKLIKQALTNLKNKRKFLVLLQKNYQSACTVLVSFDDRSLIIDKPVDWQGFKRIRVLFKDDAMVWNYCNVAILEETQDTLKTEFPIELFRNQRRAHFRVDVPVGSSAVFKVRDTESANVIVHNVSIGGMMFCFADKQKPVTMNDREIVTNIVIKVPEADICQKKNSEVKELNSEVSVAKAVFVRSFTGEDGVNLCLGLQFIQTAKEEKKLTKFVRQLELASLRKGLGKF